MRIITGSNIFLQGNAWCSRLSILCVCNEFRNTPTTAGFRIIKTTKIC